MQFESLWQASPIAVVVPLHLIPNRKLYNNNNDVIYIVQFCSATYVSGLQREIRAVKDASINVNNDRCSAFKTPKRCSSTLKAIQVMAKKVAVSVVLHILAADKSEVQPYFLSV